MQPGRAQVEAKRRQGATQGRAAEPQGAPTWPQGEAKRAQEEPRVRPREAKRSPSGAQGSQDRGQGGHRSGKMKPLEIIGFTEEKLLSGAFGGPSRAHVGHKVRVFWLRCVDLGSRWPHGEDFGVKRGNLEQLQRDFFFFSAPARL